VTTPGEVAHCGAAARGLTLIVEGEGTAGTGGALAALAASAVLLFIPAQILDQHRVA